MESHICSRGFDVVAFALVCEYQSDCGIRPTTATEIEWLQDYVRKSNNAAAANAANKNGESNKGGHGEEHSEEDDEDENSEGPAPSTSGSKRNSLTIINGLKSPTLGFHMDTDKTPTTNTLLSQAQASAAQRTNYHAQATIRRHNLGGAGDPAPQQPQVAGMGAAAFMGAAPVRPARALPGFPDIEEALGAADPSSPHGLAAREVWRWFEEHLDALLDAVRGYRFDQFEMCLRGFWGNLQGDHREVCHAPAVAGLMARADALVYNVSLLFVCLFFFVLLHLRGSSTMFVCCSWYLRGLPSFFFFSFLFFSVCQ